MHLTTISALTTTPKIPYFLIYVKYRHKATHWLFRAMVTLDLANGDWNYILPCCVKNIHIICILKMILCLASHQREVFMLEIGSEHILTFNCYIFILFYFPLSIKSFVSVISHTNMVEGLRWTLMVPVRYRNGPLRFKWLLQGHCAEWNSDFQVLFLLLISQNVWCELRKCYLKGYGISMCAGWRIILQDSCGDQRDVPISF